MSDIKNIFVDDCECLYKCKFIPWERLCGKSILISGATGLIGSSLVRALDHYNTEYGLNCCVIALVRDTEKAKKLFGERITLIHGNVESKLDLAADVDYIIHGACPTASAFMISNPVEVIKASILGTMNLLEIAKDKGATFLFLSSMEVYGEVKTEELLCEDDLGYVDPLVIRNCYPESKRMCEAIVASYAKEYGIDAMSIRLAQTFGPGIDYSDKRVFAMMARSVIEGHDIVLKTKGESRHPYLYTSDALSAILTVLLKGEAGKSYNAANASSYCSIYEMGEMVANEFGDGKCQVKVSNDDSSMYPNTTYLNLDISAITALGWKAEIDLKEMYSRLIEYMRMIR